MFPTGLPLTGVYGVQLAEGNDMDNALADDDPVVQFVNRVLLDCLKGGASEIRLECDGKWLVANYIVDGSPQEAARADSGLWDRVANRIQVMARIADRGPASSKDGRISVKYSGNVAVFLVTAHPDGVRRCIVLRRETSTDRQR